jgi:hypothetical protein
LHSPNPRNYIPKSLQQFYGYRCKINIDSPIDVGQKYCVSARGDIVIGRIACTGYYPNNDKEVTMKNILFIKRMITAGVLFFLLVPVPFGQDADIKSRFESEYNAWKEYVAEYPFSDFSFYNLHQMEIAKLGPAALTLIIEKMEKNESGFDFQLHYAFFLITRKVLEKEEWPQGTLGDARTGARMYINWWNNGIKETKNDFDRYYSARNMYLDKKNVDESVRQLNHIKGMGIVAIPYMVDKIKEGDLVFIEIISDFSNQDLKADATKEQCLEWWSKNSSKYTIVKAE